MQAENIAAEFQGAFVAQRVATKYLVVHHAAAQYQQWHGIDDVKAIRNWHVEHNKWGGVGYHEVLAEHTQNGPIAAYITSNPLTMRAHIWGRNHEAWGICMAADFSRGIPEQKWIDALSLRLVEAKKRWPNAQIVGHRDITLAGHATACPGNAWSSWKLPLLRQVEVMLSAEPKPPVGLYRARYRAPIYESPSGKGALWGVLEKGERVTIDKQDYPSHTGHLADHRGFARLEDLIEETR